MVIQNASLGTGKRYEDWPEDPGCANGGQAVWLQRGDRVTLSVNYEEADWNRDACANGGQALGPSRPDSPAVPDGEPQSDWLLRP